MAHDYIRHIRMESVLKNYTWCGLKIDYNSCDGEYLLDIDTAVLYLVSETYQQPCKKCINRIKLALEENLTLEKLAKKIPNREKSKYAIVVPKGDPHNIGKHAVETCVGEDPLYFEPILFEIDKITNADLFNGFWHLVSYGVPVSREMRGLLDYRLQGSVVVYSRGDTEDAAWLDKHAKRINSRIQRKGSKG